MRIEHCWGGYTAPPFEEKVYRFVYDKWWILNFYSNLDFNIFWFFWFFNYYFCGHSNFYLPYNANATTRTMQTAFSDCFARFFILREFLILFIFKSKIFYYLKSNAYDYCSEKKGIFGCGPLLYFVSQKNSTCVAKYLS